MTLSSMWKREKLKRDRFRAERQRCDRNWIFHKDRVVSVFEEFTEIDDRFTFYPYDAERNAGWDFSTVVFGRDFVVLSEFSRDSRCWAIHDNGTSKYVEDERESGGSLTVHYTYNQALIQVFLKPPQSNKSFIDKADVLLWIGRNTDDLTVQFCERLIAKYLLFCRVESNYERSSFWERRRVRWWRFMDARNRMQVLDTHVNFFTPWEIATLFVVTAAFGAIVSILKL